MSGPLRRGQCGTERLDAVGVVRVIEVVGPQGLAEGRGLGVEPARVGEIHAGVERMALGLQPAERPFLPGRRVGCYVLIVLERDIGGAEDGLDQVREGHARTRRVPIGALRLAQKPAHDAQVPLGPLFPGALAGPAPRVCAQQFGQTFTAVAGVRHIPGVE